ncbi:MAG: sugar phosphate isomerase/epimerase, partial [Colwellia sp.]|nr:sugar phosphate isomerase/epimerase [Colwellia sp.]
MKKIKGPAIFLAQFMGEAAPFNDLASLCGWAADLGYKGIQLPTDPKLFDLDKAAQNQAYCDEITKIVTDAGLVITELSTHIQGQLVAVHPAYDQMFDSFAPPALRNNPPARTLWAIEQLKCAAKASARLGLTAHATFSGALLWHTFYPWPQR